MRSSVGFTTHLRVFEPISALPPGEREHWQGWLVRRRDAGGLPDAASAVREEHRAGLAMAATDQQALGRRLGAEDALVLVVDGLTYICPLDTSRRVWAAVADFSEGLAPALAQAFVPQPALDAALESFDRIRGLSPTPPHVRTSTWHVPLAWFLLVDQTEAELTLGTGPQDPARALRWTTLMSSARRRAAQSLRVLQQTIPEAPTVIALEDVARWLEDFHPYSRVQLDYGDLVTQLDDEFLTTDTSVRELADGLGALARGDGISAAQAYEQVVRRWRPVQGRERAS